jgi:hypothetical protein
VRNVKSETEIRREGQQDQIALTSWPITLQKAQSHDVNVLKVGMNLRQGFFVGEYLVNESDVLR